jgi:hypothetical protein
MSDCHFDSSLSGKAIETTGHLMNPRDRQFTGWGRLTAKAM